jgi:hypothetical protein
MSENDNTIQRSQSKAGPHGSGPAVAVILVVVIMILGGLYFLYARLGGGL